MMGMRGPEQTWLGAAVAFLGMWIVMMVAMMLPSAIPMLGRYRRAVAGIGGVRLGLLIAIVGVGYFFVWSVIGVIAFPLIVAVATVQMKQPTLARIAPLVIGVVVAIAGACQFTEWKARRLACCRQAPGCGRGMRGDAGTAWRHGMRLGVDCVRCCGNLMAILLVVGIMDVRAMVLVGAAITAERLAPAGERVARGIGVVVVGVGVVLIARAAGLG
jgi:predicted metal-binding membrane protein